ncbi:MAG: mitochondrial fission ELM1 family protein, partial [Synergistaceae bacterium]|nr:mitochondrial fission ELM1 family protein [Synergistaceae bacterium]
MLNKIIILTDGIRGHYHQSLGIANWLKRLSNAEVETVSVPKFKGVKRFLYLKIFARFIKFNALKWLELVNFSYKDLKADLFISAGSSAAPFCLALAKVYNAKCAVVMTPSVLGVKPFDFAIIPEHDNKNLNLNNALITLGAPNHIYKPELKAQAASFFKDLKFNKSKIIAVLIGGSDANYDVNEAWAERVINKLLNAAEACNAELLITTSRRTGKQVDNKINAIINRKNFVKYFLPASKYPDVNPVPAMLGLASHVIATEDSVSMVSEAVTAGFKVGLLRTDKQGGLLAKIKNLLGYGTSRFDKLFDKFIERGMVIDLGQGDFENFVKADSQVNNESFNEAERAARFILDN